jgi:uncharacterized membrane protein (UPF0127 family)
MLMQFLYNKIKFETKKVRIKKIPFNIMIADSLLKQMLGLMYRKNIDEHQGMLFIFKVRRKYSFWMLNMKFPIDILWIDKSYKIVDILKNAKPCGGGLFKCKPYTPKKEALFVLELKSGISAKMKIKIGNTLDIKDIA